LVIGDELVHTVEVPTVIGRVLVVPLDLAGLDVDGDGRAREQVIALAQVAVPRAGVAGSKISQAGLGALKYGQELKKDESEQMYREALSKHYGVDPMIQRAQALQDPAIARQFAKMKDRFTVLIIQGHTDTGSMVVEEFYHMDTDGYLTPIGAGVEKFKDFLTYWKNSVEAL
jgi:hypothetical protein